MAFQLLTDLFSWEFMSSFYPYCRDNLGTGRQPGNETLEGKTVVITGGSAGIGKETALDLAKRGARVIITCRNLQKGKASVEYIRRNVPSADVTVKRLDLASFSSIRSFAQELLENEKHINILINNAGTVNCVENTEEGFEVNLGVNHLGHFLLTNLLLEKIKASAPARIINVSSLLHLIGRLDVNDLRPNKDVDPNAQNEIEAIILYSRSKLCNILFTKELAKRLEGSGVTTFCLHPGMVHSEICRKDHLGEGLVARIYAKISEMFFRSPEEGARTVVYCAVDESIKKESGLYYCNCQPLQVSKAANSDELAKKLWIESEKLVGLV